MIKRIIRPELILALCSIILSFIIIEISVRTVFNTYAGGWYGYPAELFIADDARGYKFASGYQGSFTEYPYKGIPISINSAGLRDVEHDLNVATGTYRILGLGDSVTFGSGIAIEDTYLSHLENLLKKDRPAEIIKAGVNGYEFDQYSDYYLSEGYKYKPDLVLVGFVLNDINPITPEKIELMKKNKGGYASPETPKGFVSSLKAMVKNACHTCLIAARTIKFSPVARGRTESNLAYTNGVLKLWDTDWDRLREKILSMRQFAEKQGSKLVVVIFPYTEQFAVSDNLRRTPQERLTMLGEQEGFKVIDLTSVLDTPNYEQFYLQGDNVHPNSAGHRFVAEKIGDELVKSGIIK